MRQSSRAMLARQKYLRISAPTSQCSRFAAPAAPWLIAARSALLHLLPETRSADSKPELPGTRLKDDRTAQLPCPLNRLTKTRPSSRPTRAIPQAYPTVTITFPSRIARSLMRLASKVSSVCRSRSPAMASPIKLIMTEKGIQRTTYISMGESSSH